MAIKNFSDLSFEGTVCQFMDTAELIEATSQGYKLRCMLKPSAEFSGAFVAEVWGYDQDTQQDELQGILAILPDTANGNIHVLRGKTLSELKEAMRQALATDIYERLIVDDAPAAAPASWRTDSSVVLDLVGQGGTLH